MKFNDAYRRANDSVHVRDSLKEQIQLQYEKETTVVPVRSESRRRWFVAIPTALAATAAVFVAVFVGVRAGTLKNAAPQAPAMLAADAAIEVLGESKAESRDALLTVGSYEALGEIMRSRSVDMSKRDFGYFANDVPAAVEEAPAPEPVPTSSGEANLQSAGGIPTSDGSEKDETVAHSGTNNQVQGVDEADIVKTDGQWIYALNTAQNKVYILSAKGEDTKIVSSIRLKDNSGYENRWQDYSEMLLYKDRLYLLGTYYDWSKDWSAGEQVYVFAEVYELGDRTEPKAASTLKQQGSYRTARLIGDLLVIVSDYQFYGFPYNGTDPVPFCPRIATNEDSKTLEPGDIYVNPDSHENGFAVVTTINAADGTEFDSHKAVLGGCNTVYCSGTDLLIASQEWNREQSEEQTAEDGKHFVKITSGTKTNLFRFTIADGQVEAVASTQIPGALLNQFSMDAHDGYFRVVVTRTENEEIIWTDGVDTYEWNNRSDCALYVLDGAFNTVGTIEDLAKDERIQSVRFMGDVAYFVTFRQVDPLFATDLSDPADPKILSALKVSGFSAYLHPFGKGRLLGIGYEADEKTGGTTGVKISLFDISDPTDVTELTRQKISADYTTVQYNHKAVFVDAEKGVVAFPANEQYFVCRVSDSGVELLGTIDMSTYGWSGDARGLTVGEQFYVVTMDAVTVLSFETMQKLKEIKLD